MISTKKSFVLPEWTSKFLKARSGKIYCSAEEKMTVAIEAAELNVKEHSGGPFGAAIFDRRGELISVGVNQVEAQNCSVLHAEIIALILAQERIGSYSLRAPSGELSYSMSASAAPCVMCFGGIHWAGIGRLIIGASKEDVEAIGFDEGPLHPQWIEKLTQNGTEVVQNCMREAAVRVLNLYRELGGKIYNR